MQKFTILPDGSIKDRFCPFQTGGYAVDGYQRTMFMRQNCNTSCAHFEKFEDGKGKITCSGYEKMVQLQKEEKETVKLVKS
jgi:hypothetical protein